MEVTALCSRLLLLLLLIAQIQSSSQEDDAVFPRIDPNRLQFFEYESISLTCTEFHGPTEWRVMTKTPSIASRWETSATSLNIEHAFELHSGEYWCETEGGERSSALNINVTAGKVILDIPALPVIERQAVTLHCRKRDPTSMFPANFYKNGFFIKMDYTGRMNITVTKCDEGFYKCEMPGVGESPESQLAVRAHHKETLNSSSVDTSHHTCHAYLVLRTVFTIVMVTLLLLLVGLLHFGKLKLA